MFITKPLIDSSGRFIVCYVNSSSQIILARFNGSTGALIDQTSFTDCVADTSINKPFIAKDPSDNVFLAYPISVAGQGVNIKLIKLSASDITTVSATLTYGINTSADDYQVKMFWDSNVLYVINATSNGSIAITKLNSNLGGVASTQTVVESGASHPSISVNSNYVVIAYIKSSKVHVTRMNTSLGLPHTTSTVALGITEGDESDPQIHIQYGDYITVGYRTVVNGVSKNKIFKMSHLFELTWNVTSGINLSGNDNYFNDLAISSDYRDVYYASYSQNDVYLYKINNAGQVLWSQSTALELNSGSTEYNPVIAIGTDSIYVACVSDFIGGTEEILMGKYTVDFTQDSTLLGEIRIPESNLSFNIHKSTYEATISNATGSVNITLAKGFSVQTLSTSLNSVVLNSLSNVAIPIGRNTLAVTVTSANALTSATYYVYLTRTPPQTVYVDLAAGTTTGAGASGSPINSLSRALSLNVPVVLKLKQFIPSALVGESTITLNPQAGGGALSSVYDSFKTMSLPITNSNRKYFINTMSPVVSDINGYDSIMSFFIKQYDTQAEDIVSSGLNQPLTFTISDYANRSYLILYRVESDGSYTNVGNATRVNSTEYSITLTSNSVYTLVDSGVLYTGPGVGSDPYVTTIFGHKYQIPKIRGRNNHLTLIKNKTSHLKAHMTGLYDGDYLDRVVLESGRESILDINFSKKTSKINNREQVKQMFVKDVSVDHFKPSKKLNEVFFVKSALHPGGVYLVVNYQHRYVFPVFNHALTKEDVGDLSGILIG